MSMELPPTPVIERLCDTCGGPHATKDHPTRQEEQETFEQKQQRWLQRGLDDAAKLELPADLRERVRESLLVPQLGPYHNEGPIMAAHVGLILENIDALRAGTMELSEVGLTPELAQETAQRIAAALAAQGERMRAYAYLHDIEKTSTMNVEDATKQQRPFPMAEWIERLHKANGDATAAMAALKAEGVTKVGYRIGGKLAKQLGVPERDHGEEGDRVVRELMAAQPDGAERLRELDTVLKGIANHELHFQVFSNASSAEQYRKQLAERFTEDEIDFIFAAVLVDVLGSLNAEGKPDFGGFRNMVLARANHELIAASGLTDPKPLLKLATPDEVRAGIEKLLLEAKAAKIVLDAQGVAELKEAAAGWGVPSDQLGAVTEALSALENQPNPANVFAQKLPGPMRRYVGNLKQYLSRRVSES